VPVCPEEQELRSVGRPLRPVDVLPLVARAHIHRDALGGRRDLDDLEPSVRVAVARLGVALDIGGGEELGEPTEHREGRHLRIVEAVIGEPLRVRAPPHAGGLVKLLAVDPARGAEAEPVASLGGHLDRDGVVAILLPRTDRRDAHVALDRCGHPESIRRRLDGPLPATARRWRIRWLRRRRRRRLGTFGSIRDLARRDAHHLPCVALSEPELPSRDVPPDVTCKAARTALAPLRLHLRRTSCARKLLVRGPVRRGPLRSDARQERRDGTGEWPP